MISDGGYQQKAGAVAFGGPQKTAPAKPQRTAEDAMAASIVHLLKELEETRNERDFYKSAASKLMRGKPHNGRRKS